MKPKCLMCGDTGIIWSRNGEDDVNHDLCDCQFDAVDAEIENRAMGGKK